MIISENLIWIIILFSLTVPGKWQTTVNLLRLIVLLSEQNIKS